MEKELAELRESEARSRIVMETVSDAIVTIDVESVIRYANRAAERVFGYAVAEMLGAPLTMLMPEYLRHLHEAGMRRYVETGHKHIAWDGVELPGLHKSGREMALELSFGEFEQGGKRYFTGVARDITERKRAERRQAAQHEVTRLLAETPRFGEAVQGILRAVCESLGWELGVLWRLDEGAEALRFGEMWHAGGVSAAGFRATNARRTFARGEGLPGQVWRGGEPVWMSDVQTNSHFTRAPAAAAAGLHGAFAFPILLHGEVLGVLEFFSREVRGPDEALLSMLSNVGSQMGQVIERQRAEDERARLSEQVIQMQEAQLEELSTPLIPLTDRVVVMPLVGAVDAKRAGRMVDTLLRGLVERRAAIAIIDITGVTVVDAHVANTLIQAAQAARLVGAEVVLTGIRPGVAQSLVGLGLEIHAVATRKSLQSGLAYAFERLRRGPGNL